MDPRITQTMKIKVSKSILGDVYSFRYTVIDSEGTSVDCDTRILFSARPMLMWGQGGLCPIDSPERFGTWDSPKARREYCARFAS